MHAHAHKRPPPPSTSTKTLSLALHLHFNSTVFLGLTCCLHMQQHVLRVSNPSSKQIANHTDRKYVLFSQSSSFESLAGLFHTPTFFKEWKKFLFGHIFVSRQSAILYLHATKHCSFHMGEDKKFLKRCSLVSGDINRLTHHVMFWF